MKRKFFFGIFLLACFPAIAQVDNFTGDWTFETESSGKPLTMTLKIGPPEKGLLYPTEMMVQHDSFVGSYELLLVKRNVRQLSIGRNKIAASEFPFSLEEIPLSLNGVLDLSKDKGSAFLTTERLLHKQTSYSLKKTAALSSANQIAAAALTKLFTETEIKLRKSSATTFNDIYIDSILRPGISEKYFGIIDTVSVPEKNGSINFTCNKKASGTVSVMLNGNPVIDQNDLGFRKSQEDIRLDTGLNILALFADNYGKTPAATGCLQASFGTRNFTMDFANAKDLGAGFIVAKVYYAPEKEEEKQSMRISAQSIQRMMSEKDVQDDIKRFHYPDPDSRHLLQNETERKEAEKALLRNAKPVGNIQANAREIILALWDDAVEDGDSISLNINGHWVVQRFPVKKRPQYISVKLDPGPNKIIFIADNLGAIVPNTAILEIIDGRQRRSFMIDTDLGRNNLINILYNLGPE